MELNLIAPRGFCAGVERAIKTVELALEKFGAPVYVKHAIVHNDHVLKRLEKLGAIFVEEIKDIPDHSIVIFSAHGVTHEVKHEAKAKHLKIIDATCSLVTRVHSAVKRFKEKNYQIILVGHKNHVEVIGTASYGEGSLTVVENEIDVENLNLDPQRPIFMTTQTTLSLLDVAAIHQRILDRYPNVITLPTSSICYATTNRQTALLEAIKTADCIIVVGDSKSSNSKRLQELGQKKGIDSYLIHDKDHLDLNLFKHKKNVALTAGASTPEDIIQGVIQKIQSLPQVHVTCSQIIDEDVHFSLPQELSVISN